MCFYRGPQGSWNVIGRISSASATLFLSMVLAMAMLVLLWVYAPLGLDWIQDGADLIEDTLSNTGLPAQYNNGVRIFASDDKIVLLLFTVIARIIIGVAGSAMSGSMFKDTMGKQAGNLIGRIGTTFSTLFLSFVLAIFMLVIIWASAPELLQVLLDQADSVENFLAGLSLPERYSTGLRLIVSDEKILLLFFTIIARIMLAIIATTAMSAIGRND
jgi:hypothetical protein